MNLWYLWNLNIDSFEWWTMIQKNTAQKKELNDRCDRTLEQINFFMFMSSAVYFCEIFYWLFYLKNTAFYQRFFGQSLSGDWFFHATMIHKMLLISIKFISYWECEFGFLFKSNFSIFYIQCENEERPTWTDVNDSEGFREVPRSVFPSWI